MWIRFETETQIQRSVSKLRQTNVLLQVQGKERVGEQKLSVLPKLESGVKCLFPNQRGGDGCN